ncbi:hypothetical protein [Streptomyces sp. NPDC006879]|uniref:hypothetical protein n=1 Tax=Streptomyces sp. NPDC006879 TaxID=3364767 RepID=UPI0036B172AC
MKARPSLAALLLGLSSMLAGCASNDCSSGSVCGNGNAIGSAVTGSSSPTEASDPLTFTVEENDPWDACDNGQGIVFDPPVPRRELSTELAANTSVGTPQEARSYRERLAAFDDGHHGTPANYTLIGLNVQGTSRRAVTIKDVTVHRLTSLPVPAGAVRVQRMGACGGANLNRFATDISSSHPVLTFTEGESAAGTMRTRGFPVQVSESDPENLVVFAYALRDSHTFVLSIEWSSEGVTGTTEVRRHDGKPFAVTSARTVEQLGYGQDGGFESLVGIFDPDNPF